MLVLVLVLVLALWLQCRYAVVVVVGLGVRPRIHDSGLQGLGLDQQISNVIALARGSACSEPRTHTSFKMAQTRERVIEPRGSTVPERS